MDYAASSLAPWSASRYHLVFDDAEHQWMQFLISTGEYITASDATNPLTVALCLPRIEYAGLLVAAGACLHAAKLPITTDWQLNLNHLLNKRIAYSFHKNPYVYWEGVLSELNANTKDKVKIQGVKNGPPTEWLLTDFASILHDPQRHAEELPDCDRGKKAFRDDRSKRLRSILPESAIGKLCSWWYQITLVGTCNRLIEEMNELLPLEYASPAECTFADLIRPDRCVDDSPITRLLSPKDLTCEYAGGFVIIEGSRRLSEHLNVSRQHHRIILLGRNEPYYSDAADVVNNHFMQRKSDAMRLPFESPEHIYLKIFHH